jgi:hypothetical protein
MVVRELSTTFAGRAKTFRFPYTTDSQEEFEYLAGVGAKYKRALRRPNKINQPLKGGDEK